MYPKLKIDLGKLETNARRLLELSHTTGVEPAFVTKVFCADERIVSMLSRLPIKYLADSRLENLRRYGDIPQKKLLLRLPMLSQVDEVVRHSDISLNSELVTLQALDRAAGALGRRHGVIIMLDLGDLREGIPVDDRECWLTVARFAAESKWLELTGVGTNLTCYGSVIPTEENLGRLCECAKTIERELGVRLSLVSGGNSSSIYLAESRTLPDGVNNLRLGEAFALGRETAFGNRISGAFGDAVTAECEIVEVFDKPSFPVGEIGVNAFGERPVYVDRGVRRRAIAALGRQDIDPNGLTPLISGVEVVGASSDHLILDVTGANNISVGSTIGFSLDYSALLRAFSGSYLYREYLGD